VSSENEVTLVYAIDLLILILRRAVEDDTVTQLMDDLARPIRRCEDICDETNKNDDQDDALKELDYVEDLIGVSFVALQTKIRRVSSSAAAVN
jgi:hypothetical protein